MKTSFFVNFSVVLTGFLTLSATSAKAAPGDLQLIKHLGDSSQSQLEAQGNNPNVIPLKEAGIPTTHPAPKNGVRFYEVIYESVGAKGEKISASGLLMTPDSQSKPLPLLSYQHATETDRAQVPSSYEMPGGDATRLAIDFGSQGYIVIAADYIGLGDSPGFHPYFHAPTLESATVDMLRASKTALASLGVTTNGQLFLTGYSEGGNATMFLHHALETQLKGEFTVTASAPMAGVYDLPESIKTVLNHPSQINPAISSAELAMMVSSYNSIYGGIYSSPSDVFQTAFAGSVNSTPGGAFDGLHTPQDLLKILSIQGKPAAPLEVYQSAWIADVMKNPNDQFIKLAELNNAYKWSDWKPVAPIRFYQGGADTEVPTFNHDLATAWLESIGVPTEFVDLGATVDHGSGALLGYPLALQWFESLRR